MNNNTNDTHAMTAQEFTDVMIRVGIVFVLIVLCFRVFSPFMNLMMWALILGVTLYPLHQKLASKLGGNQGRAAIVMVLAGLLLLGYPSVKLGSSLAGELTDIHDAYQAGTLALPEPNASVAEWPVIGEDVYSAWQAADDNLPAFVEANKSTIESVMKGALATAKSTASGIGLFMAAFIVAGIMMAFGQGGSGATLAIFSRIAGPEQGPKMHNLSTMTTRSVAVGVLGVAVIQAVLMGLVFIIIGVPAAGILALIVLLLAIMQLPATLVGIPVIIWVWNGGDAGTTMNTIWTIVIIVAGLADNVLKPMLLGRGVDAPMPVILIGALGGMISTGFIGLFIGAVVLAVGYQIFMEWVAMHEIEEEASPAADAAAE
ncbi:MAG: AI-2E family transporter [Halioglobus sp.]